MSEPRQVYAILAKTRSDDDAALFAFDAYVISAYPTDQAIQDCRTDPSTYRFLTVIPDEMREFLEGAADAYEGVDLALEVSKLPRDEYLADKRATEQDLGEELDDISLAS